MEDLEEATLKLYGVNVELFRDRLGPSKQPLVETKPAIKRLPPSNQRTASAKKLREHCYNLRGHKKTDIAVKTSKRRKLPCGLLPVNPSEYHPFKSDSANQLIRVTLIPRPEQVESYKCGTSEFIMLSWLTTARIFRYETSEKSYSEIKRIPDRYIDIADNIITCLHYCEGKFYIAHLWSKHDRRPYIEIRDTGGNVVHNALHFNEGDAVNSIYSDRDFIYIKTTSGLLDIHRKEFFKVIHYCIDFSHSIGHSVQSTWVDQPSFDSYTRMPLVSATCKEILVTIYDVVEQKHNVKHCYRFNDEYDIVSMTKVDRLYIIHRRLKDKSIIDFGYLGRTLNCVKDPVFIHESSIKFASNVLQMKVVREHLYVFGSTEILRGLNNHEIGCIYIPSLLPLWVHRTAEANDKSLIIPHSSGIGLINGCHYISHIPMISNKLTEEHKCKSCGFCFPSKDELKEHQSKWNHKSILSDMEITTNRFLNESASSIFRKLHPHETKNGLDENW